ncbi:hypothetical protein M3Y94_00896000 [Aphelenchoides besseyi]|nr:hypothetical protein M3Y94_00896000 [Aphelenchoides besseyi]KAI6223398.1 Eukaryotic aspartyl protease [Aphelenchoides besseyi]
MSSVRVLFCVLILVATFVDAFDIGIKRKTKHRNTRRGHLARDNSKISSSSGYAEKVQAFRNLQYTGLVSVGNPPQTFEVILDTGSDLFWLPKVGCTSSGPDVKFCKSGKGLYDPSKSKTAHDLHRTFQIEYGTGSAVGEYFSDEMSFGNAKGSHVSIGNVTLGAASTMRYSDQGILGLSFAQRGDPTPIFELAVQRGIFENPIFTVFLANCNGNCENGGVIKLGSTNPQNCGKAVGSAKIVGNTPYWRFNLDGITANGHTVKSTRNGIADTGTSIIAGPTSVIRQIATSFNAQLVQGTYVVPCNAKLHLSFKINGHEYTINEKQLIQEGVVATGNGVDYCQLNLDGDNQLEFMILGDPFIRGFCLIQNVKEKTITFAPVRTN